MTDAFIYEYLWRVIRRLILFAVLCFWIGYLIG